MFDRFKQLYSLQKKGKQIQKELKETEIEAISSDGKIKVLFSGEIHLRKIEIDPSLLSAENKNLIEKGLEQTISEAISRAQAIAASKSKELMKDLGVNLPGM